MSGIDLIAQTAEIALTAATAKTVIQAVAAANHRIRVKRWGVFFDGVSATAEPVQVRLVRQTTAGTMTALTPVKLDPDASETVQTTFQHTATVEPTITDTLDVVEIHPQQGWEFIYPPGQEQVVRGGARIGIECTAPAGVNVRAKLVIEE